MDRRQFLPLDRVCISHLKICSKLCMEKSDITTWLSSDSLSFLHYLLLSWPITKCITEEQRRCHCLLITQFLCRTKRISRFSDRETSSPVIVLQKHRLPRLHVSHIRWQLFFFFIASLNEARKCKSRSWWLTSHCKAAAGRDSQGRRSLVL